MGDLTQSPGPGLSPLRHVWRDDNREGDRPLSVPLITLMLFSSDRVIEPASHVILFHTPTQKAAQTTEIGLGVRLPSLRAQECR